MHRRTFLAGTARPTTNARDAHAASTKARHDMTSRYEQLAPLMAAVARANRAHAEATSALSAAMDAEAEARREKLRAESRLWEEIKTFTDEDERVLAHGLPQLADTEEQLPGL